MTLVANSAHYHQSCQLKFNNTKYVRAEKRSRVPKADVPVLPACKHSRSQSTEVCVTKNVCFFCGEASGNSGMYEAATFQIDKRVRSCAVQLEDTELLAKLSTGDMVTLEAKYHSKCLVGLYNRARMIKSEGGNIDETN